VSIPTIDAPEGSPTQAELTSQLSEYRGFRCIGAGAMGVVYEALHCPLDRTVAIKVLSPSVLSHRKTVQRFFQEARAMAQISHPHIVKVFEVGGEGALPYFSMELVVGGSLKERLHGAGPLPPRDAAETAREIALALGHAHDNGLYHRDVKPGNVLLDAEGLARLADFGLVRRTDSVTMTASDAIVGTPQYMSPEQVRGDAIDGRSDEFSLGATLYESLTGRAPFSGDNPVSVLRAICEVPAPSIRKLRAEIPVSLEAIVFRMLEKVPAHRYPDMKAVAEDLGRYLRGEAVEATLPGAVTRSWRRLRANRVAFRFATAAAVGVLVAAMYLTNELVQERHSRFNGLLAQASTELNAGQPGRVGELLGELSGPDARRPEALKLRARAATALGDPAAALELLEASLQEDPEDLEAVRLAKDNSLALGEYESALSWMVRVRKLLGGTPAEGEAVAQFPVELALEWAILDRRTAFARVGEVRTIDADFAAGRAGLDWRDRRRIAAVRAARNIDEARSMLALHAESFGASLEARRELAMLACLEVFLDVSPERRFDRLQLAYDEIKAFLEVAPYELEAQTYGRMVMEEVGRISGASEEWRSDAASLLDQYQLLKVAAEGARDIARSEFQRTLQSTTAPDAGTVVGPLGKARDFVGGLVGGLFGGGD